MPCSVRAEESYYELCGKSLGYSVHFAVYQGTVEVPWGFNSTDADACGWVSNGTISYGACTVTIVNGQVANPNDT